MMRGHVAMNALHSLLCASVALFVVTPAWAQDADDASSSSTVQDELVVVASGVEQPVAETGRAVTTIDRAEIERRQTVVLSDLLATTPGVTVTRNGGVGTVTSVRIRGAESEQTLVLIDGVRVNDPSNPGASFDFGNLLAGSVERVEVLRGPNSVVWGSQAVGGVVNVVTADADGPLARGNVEYGYADTVSANAALSGRSGAFSGAVTGGYYRTDGISAAANGNEKDGYRQYGATGRLGIEFAPGVSLDLRAYYADSRTDLDGFPPPTYGFADTDEYSTAQEIYGYAGLSARVAGINNRIAFTIADINRDNYDPASGSAPTFIGRGRSERYLYRGDTRIGAIAQAVFGVEHENTRFDDGSTEYSTGMTSGYAELILRPVDALTLTGGVRYDDHRMFGNRTTFGANIAYAAGPGTVFRASYGEGFKAPTLYQLYSYYGDPTLTPETSESWEAGVDQSLLDGAMTFSATVFRRDTSDQIDFDMLTWTYSNIARTRATGVELETRLVPTEGLVLTGNYTHVDTENRSAGSNYGNDLARRPEDTASVSVDYRFPFGVSAGATVTMVGDSFDNAGNTARLDGYALVGVRAEVPLNDALVLYGRIDNLFDAEYQVVSGYGTIGRAAYGGIRLRFQ